MREGAAGRRIPESLPCAPLRGGELPLVAHDDEDGGAYLLADRVPLGG